MKPLSISLKNYKSYGDDETTVRLDVKSIRLIVGKSGSGKTSIIDAIIWCLYGKSLSNADDIVNRQTKKNCKVEFIFSIREDLFSIIRYRKHDENANKVLVFKNNKNISPVKVTDAQLLIQDIIEISANSLVSSVIFSSEIYSSFMREKNSIRLNIFEGILSLRQINKWNEVTKKLLKPITVKLLESSGKKTTADQVTISIQENIDRYKEGSIETLKKFRKEKEEISQEIGFLQNERKDVETIDISENLLCNENYDEAKRKNKNISISIKSLIEKRNDTSALLVKINEVKNEIEKSSSVNTEDYIKDYETYKEIIEKNEKFINEIKILQSQFINEEELGLKEKKLKEEIEEIKKEIQEMEDEMTCPTCHQKLPEELQNELGLIKTRKEILGIKEIAVSNISISIQSAETYNVRLNVSIEILTEQIVKIEKKDFRFTPQEIRELDQKRNKRELELKLLEKEFEGKDVRNEEINKEIKVEEKKLVELPEAPKYETLYLETLSVRVLEIEKEINESFIKMEIIDGKAKSAYDANYVSELEGKKLKLQEAIDKLVKDLKKQSFEERHHKLLLDIFSNKEGGLKKVIIGQMINVFNNEVNKYLPLFFDELMEISFDKNLSETIKINNVEVDFNTFSSGEKTRFEFAVAFSLYMLVKNFFSKDISFIVFDEILDVNLDEESLEKVLAVVQELGVSNSILVISHRVELKDIFTNHIYVSKDNNGLSIIKEAS